ncbi:squalene synthetase-like protein [Thecaphora frezii]
MGKRGGNGNRGGGGGGGRGRGSGPPPGRGRGRGRGGGRGAGSAGFIPFSGFGQVLGDASLEASSGYNSPRGGRGRGSPANRGFGRGRGSNLSVYRQNQVGFDYSSLTRSSRARDARDDDDKEEDEEDDEEDEEDDQDDADFLIEPPKGYQHRHKPHLEIPSQSSPRLRSPAASPSVNGGAGLGQISDDRIAAIIPTGPHAGPPVYPSAKQPKGSRYKPATPTVFPEFHTTRGSGFGSRPPEENEDAKYLAGIPGLRRWDQGRDGGKRRHFRSGDPAHNDDNPLRKPLTFVKATGEWKDGKFVSFEGGDTNTADESTPSAPEPPSAQTLEREAKQEQADTFPAASERPKHAGLGFARAQQWQQQQQNASLASRDSEPELLADAMDVDGEDSVADFLKAFPGARELGPDEGMADGLAQAPSILVPSAPSAPTQNRTAEPASAEPRSSDNDSLSSDDDEIILIPSNANGAGAFDEEPASHRYADSDSEEERQLEAILGQQRSAPGEEQVEVRADDPFVIDLTGDSPRLDAADARPPRDPVDRAALGDAFVQDSSDESDESDDGAIYEINMTQRQPRGAGKKARNAAKKARRRARAREAKSSGGGGAGLKLDAEERIPREGDSDLDWGSDGPPGNQRDDLEQDVLALAAAGITFKDVEMDMAVPRTLEDESAMLEQVFEASHGISHAGASALPKARIAPTKKRSANQARKQAAAQHRKAEEAAILADYLENIRAQQANGSDDDDSEGDVQEERMDGTLGKSTATDKGKGKAKTVPLAAKLDEQTELDALIRFMNGMDPQKGGRHLSLGDVADEADLREEDEWMTEESDDDDDDDDEDEDNDNENKEADSDGDDDDVGIKQTARSDTNARRRAEREGIFGESERRMLGGARAVEDSDEEEMAEQLRKILDSEDSDLSLNSDDDDDEEEKDESEDDDDDDDNDEDEDEDDDDEDDEDDGDDDDDEDDNMFRGNFAWEEEDEAFIAKLTNSVGSGRKVQKRMFKAIEKGDFSGMMDEDDFGIDPSDPVYGIGAVAPAKRGKNKGKTWKDDDLWAEQLQEQWQRDRASKAANKKKRAAERQAAALSPFPATHKKGKKKAEKKAKRAARREAKAGGKANGWSDEADVDGLLTSFGGRNGLEAEAHELGQRFATSLAELDEQIKIFLADVGKTTLSLPPMDKRSRAQVHMLADAYTLKSKSKGKGNHRFPTLIKTSRSGLVVDQRKVRRILLGHAGASFGIEGSMKGGQRYGGGGKKSVGATGGGGMAPRNREGEEVGWGAEKIGADNIGHRLLAAMGWTEGSGIGVSGGISDPVSATVKVSKGGLGW